MAKKRGRRGGRYIKGNVDEELDLGTLASRTVASGAFDESASQRMVCTSIEATYTLAQFTDTASVGPIEVGIAHSDYDTTEITEYLQNGGSWDEGNKIQQEIARRQIRSLGIFEIKSNSGMNSVLNDGKPMKTRLNWVLNNGDTLDLWAMNLGTQPIGTTVPKVFAQGHVNLFTA